MTYRMFIDDERYPVDDSFICRSMDEFKSETGGTLRVVSDTKARSDGWSVATLDQRFDDFLNLYILVSRASPEEPAVGKWIGWNGGKASHEHGGECPVHPKTVVEVVGGFDAPWESIADPDDVAWDNVAAYRVVKPYKGPKEYWIDHTGFTPVLYTYKANEACVLVREVENDNV